MKNLARTVLSLAVPFTLAMAAAMPASADEYGRHPFYLHAIADLHAADWQIGHRRPEDGRVSQEESAARFEIAAAIGALQQAAWTDGKAMDWQPPPDRPMARAGRLHMAADLLRKAHDDVAREEDDPRSRGAQRSGIQHIDAARDATLHAIGDVRWHDRMAE